MTPYGPTLAVAQSRSVADLAHMPRLTARGCLLREVGDSI